MPLVINPQRIIMSISPTEHFDFMACSFNVTQKTAVFRENYLINKQHSLLSTEQTDLTTSSVNKVEHLTVGEAQRYFPQEWLKPSNQLRQRKLPKIKHQHYSFKLMCENNMLQTFLPTSGEKHKLQYLLV